MTEHVLLCEDDHDLTAALDQARARPGHPAPIGTSGATVTLTCDGIGGRHLITFTR